LIHSPLGLTDSPIEKPPVTEGFVIIYGKSIW
jgi:hypothetical protein